MKSAAVAVVAAATFFAGVMMGTGSGSGNSPLPAPVVLRSSGEPESPQRPQVRNTGPLNVEKVGRYVDEGEVEDYGDSSGPGSGEDEPARKEPDRKEPDGEEPDGEEPEKEELDEDHSGPGSDSSGPGSSGSGSSGSSSDSSGPGS